MKTLPLPGTTSRELLEYVAGKKHALHSVAERKRARHGAVRFVCSCGEKFEVENKLPYTHALRNVELR